MISENPTLAKSMILPEGILGNALRISELVGFGHE
jgi:hypothetical protein